MKVPGISEPPRLPIAGLRSIVVADARHPDAAPAQERLDRPARARRPAPAGPTGGWSHEAGSSCLVWQPLGSDTASALETGRLRRGSSTESRLRRRRRGCSAQESGVG